jgi:hypothetical protein
VPDLRFNFAVYQPVTRQPIGQLSVRDAAWSEVVNGGGTFNGKVTVPENPGAIAVIEACTRPDTSAVYAVPAAGGGVIGFGGPIVNRSWDDETNTITFTAIDWKTWAYQVVVGPALDGTSALSASYTNQDTLTIARAIVNRVRLQGTGQGIPPLDAGNNLSGVNINYLLTGVDFKTLGQHLDALGDLANGGFEWDIEPYYGNDGFPTPRVQFYRPQRGSNIPGLVFSKTLRGGNILKVEDMEDDSTGVYRRVWAVGEGPNAESTPWASNTDPALPISYALRRDMVTQYSGALSRAQLASYARSERLYRGVTLKALSFRVRLENPDWSQYGKGDRCRVIIKDRFLDIDVSNCRIVAREVDVDSMTAKLTVNLSDLALPEVDDGGSL